MPISAFIFRVRNKKTEVKNKSRRGFPEIHVVGRVWRRVSSSVVIRVSVPPDVLGLTPCGSILEF